MLNALLITLAAATTIAQDVSLDRNEAVWSDGNWSVYSYPDEDMCDIGFPTSSGEYVTVGYSPKTQSANLLVTNRYATSQNAGDIRSLTVAFAPSIGAAFSSRRTLSFEVVQVGEQRGFSAITTYPGFLENFASAGVMGVFTPKGAAVAAIKLTGSAEAIRQLRACAFAAAELDPRDPFLQ